MITRLCFALLLAAIAVLVSCRGSSNSRTTKRHGFSGHVAALDKARRMISIDYGVITDEKGAVEHQVDSAGSGVSLGGARGEIFEVQSEADLDNVLPDDEITADVMMGARGDLLENIVLAKRGHAYLNPRNYFILCEQPEQATSGQNVEGTMLIETLWYKQKGLVIKFTAPLSNSNDKDPEWTISSIIDLPTNKELWQSDGLAALQARLGCVFDPRQVKR